MANLFKKTAKKVKEFFTGEDYTKEEVSLEDSNEVLTDKLELRLREAEQALKMKLFEWQDALKFFRGKHWEVARVQIPTYKASVVINKFFAAVRSLVAFETDATPEPEVEAQADFGDPNFDTIQEGAKKIRDALSFRWEQKQISSIFTEIYYDRYIYADGFGMYFWNVVEDDVDFEHIKPAELLRSPGSTSIDDAEYIIIKKCRNRKWFLENYPDNINKIKFEQYSDVAKWEQGLGLMEKSERQNLAQVEYYFEDEIWIIKCGKEILEKKQNPFWEFRTAEEQEREIIEKFKVLPFSWQAVKNHLDKPEKPIVHFKGYYLGGEFYSESLIKQVMDLNLLVNKRKNQIQDNADGVGNGQWIVDPSVPEEEVRKITSYPGLKIRINPAFIKKEPGIPLPEFVFNDLLHTEQKFDDIMGHHEISRGVVPKKRMTRAETLAIRESDITPVRLVLRNSEVAISKLLNGWVQLMKLFYDQPHFISRPQIEGNLNFKIDRNEIPDNLSIIVRPGSTLPVSKPMRRLEYQQLYARGDLDPVSFFKLMDYPNPEKLAYRVLN